MNPTLQRVMDGALRLTRSGKLGAATAAIRAALTGRHGGGAEPAVDDDPTVVDVAARPVYDRAAPPRAARRGPADAPPPSADAFIDGTHVEAAGSLDYKLYLPPDHRGKPLPLVVMLHGCTQNPDDFAAGTGMNDAARERGFYVLYPAQAQRANPSRCWNWFKHNHQERGRGEPAVLAGMTRGVIARYPVDRSQVYVAGLSAGGAMAAILGQAYPELFAAVGVHSGLAAGAAQDLMSGLAAMKSGACAAPGAVAVPAPPTIVFHGDQDSTVHPRNGEHAVAASAGAAAPERLPGRSRQGRAYTRSVYRDRGGRIVAEHWLSHGAGHAWSGGRAAGSYTDAQGPDATGEILRFFFGHRLNADR